MKFGFAHVPASHYSKHIDLVLRGEQLGFDFAWIADQTFYRDPYVILTLLAEATDRIKLGLGVTNPFTRHPAMAGRAIATIAELAPGRVAFGVGAGNVKELLRPLGLNQAHVADRCREMVELVRQELSGQSVRYVGERYQMDGAALEFDAGAGVPLYLAARGRLMLETAGEVGDGVLIGALCSTAGINYALEHLRAGAAKSGRNGVKLDIGSWVTCYLTDDREAAIAGIAPQIAHIIGGAPDHVLQAVGLPSENWREIKSVYHEQGIPQAAARVTPAEIDAFAIVGDGGYCVERIRLLEDAGVTQFIFLLPKDLGVDQQAVHLERFADEVLPAF
jgi:5,10-methylenetetrahydromethanopterin reductase